MYRCYPVQSGNIRPVFFPQEVNISSGRAAHSLPCWNLCLSYNLKAGIFPKTKHTLRREQNIQFQDLSEYLFLFRQFHQAKALGR
jgi:hypothetical protein